MSFEMKYDRDGTPLKVAQPIEEPVQQMVEIQTQSEPEMVENQTEEVEAPQHVPVKQAAEKSVEKNWTVLREKAERAERERDEAIRYIKEMQARPQTAEPETEEDLSVSVEEDALVEGKHLSKVSKQIKQLKEQLKQQQQQNTLSATEMKLKSQYPDFDAIVSKENLENLRFAYPEIANTINSSTDLYSKAVSAYTMIKKLGIVQSDSFQEEKELVQKNAAKPRPLASVSPQQGDSPLSKANAFASGKLTDELKKQLYREMMESRN